MAWHKQKQYDPTEAFIQNERHQKLLNLQLEKIDKLWLHQLRILARDRLETTSELIRLEDEKSQLAYFDEHMDVHKMKEYTDNCLTQMKSLKRELTHDNFNFENTGAIVAKRSVQPNLNLPKVEELGYIVTQSLKNSKPKKKTKKVGLGKRRKSNLFRSKILSMSDSNLDMVSKYKKENNDSTSNKLNEVDTNNKLSEKSKKPGAENSGLASALLPSIPSKPVTRSKEQHRYLKEKMTTALVLPTVKEAIPRQRKLSI